MIRSARPDEVVVLAHVHRQARAAYYGTGPDPADDREQIWEHFLADPERATWVAELDGRVVGLVSAHHDELAALYVLPEHFGAGIGDLLHERYVAGLGPSTTGTLEVWAGNGRAIGFYERRGWVRTEAAREGPGGHDYVGYELRRRRTP